MTIQKQSAAEASLRVLYTAGGLSIFTTLSTGFFVFSGYNETAGAFFTYGFFSVCFLLVISTCLALLASYRTWKKKNRG